MDLFQIQSGKKKEPFNVVLAGVAGIGKTTWAAQSPEPLVIGGEETGEIDVARMPQAKTYKDFVAQVDHILAEDVGHQTLVVDTIDSVEKMLHSKILDEDPKHTNSMIAAHGGYGKAYEIAERELTNLRDKFKRLRDEKGMNIILIAHTKKAMATDAILGLAYDTYELNLHQRAQSVFVDWVSAVLFANYIVHPTTGTNTEKIFAMGDGERVLLTQKRPGHIGKNRFNLPYEMPLDFKVFKHAYDQFFEDGPNSTQIIESIAGLSDNLTDDTLKNKVFDQLKKAGSDIPKLLKIEARLKEIIK